MALTLNTCGKDGCNPVEQTRGQMKPEDHHMQYARHAAMEAIGETNAGFRKDALEVEPAPDEHAYDVRISCSKCGKATGWDRRDTEEFRRHGDGDYRRHTLARDGNLDTIRQRWNDLVK